MIDSTLKMLAGLRRQLAGTSSLADLLGSDNTWGPWIFQRRLHVAVESTGLAAVVISHKGQWAAPNQHNTARFPRVQVDIYVDPARTVDERFPKKSTAEERIEDIFVEVDRLMHSVTGEIRWGDDNGTVRIVGSKRLSDIDLAEVKDGDGLVMGTIMYGISL